MSLSLLSKPEAVRAALQEFDTLGRERFLKKYGFGESNVFLRLANGRRYDAEPILAAAVGKEHPARGPLRPDEFRASPDAVADKLDELGFSVVDAYEGSDLMITAADIELIKSSRTKPKYADLSQDERDAYQRAHAALELLGEHAASELGRPDDIALKLTSGFHPNSGVRGNLPKDIWFAVYPVENESKLAANPQLFLIVSERGLEYGFGASVHPSDFSNAAVKKLVRATAPRVFEKLPKPRSAEAETLAREIEQGGGWKFRRKHRLTPGETDFASLNDWLAFLHSPDGMKSAAGCISRYVRADEIGAINLEEEISKMARLFSPLMSRDWSGEEDDLPLFGVGSAEDQEEAPPQVDSSFGELLQAFLGEYGRARRGAFAISESLRAAMDAVTARLRHFQAVAKRPYIKVKISVGLGQWTKTPWIALLNTNVTTSTQEGIYIVFLVAEDLSVVSLTLIQGRTQLVKKLGQKGATEGMLRIASELRPQISELAAAGFALDNEIDLKSDTTAARDYEVGTIAHLELAPGNMPSDKELERHLEDLLAAYDRVVEKKDDEPDQPVDDASDEYQEENTDQTFTPPPPYSIDDAMNDLFLPREEFERLLAIWRRKKNLILQGAPGVGKSFIARRLAYALIGAKDPARVESVQFHQSYSYEDFVQGYRPDGSGGFKLQDGVFRRFRRAALNNPDETYVFVIDEINRGNLSKILGELMLLIESDKRGAEWGTHLTYAKPGEPKFFVPENLFILGMMNTADRSLSMVDYALRRRFAFVMLEPMFQSEEFRSHLGSAGVPEAIVSVIISGMSDLNGAISEDRANLGPGFRIGHSFFVPPDSFAYDDGWYRMIIETEIFPLLEEYWFDDPNKAQGWRDRLLAAAG